MWGTQNLNFGQADSKDIVAVFILSFVIFWWFNVKSLGTQPPMHISTHDIYLLPFNFYSVIETFFKRLPVAMGEEIVRPIWKWHLEAAKRKAGCWVNKWDLSFLGGPQMEVYQKQRMKPGGWSQGVFGDPRLKAENSTPPVNFSRHPTASHIHTVGTDGSNREPASALINLEEDM